MNNDLISREALKEAYFNAINETSIGEVSIIDLIDNAPTVEAYTDTDLIEENKKGFNTAKRLYQRPQGEWIVTAEDNEGVHRIQCPFCGYEKGTDFIDYITVTFEKMPPFCENCGVKLKGGKAE